MSRAGVIMKGGEARGPGRAGRYVQQPGGCRAFLPAPLPPGPPLRMNALQAPLAEASHALGRRDGSVLTLPDPDLFVLMYALPHSHHRGQAGANDHENRVPGGESVGAAPGPAWRPERDHRTGSQPPLSL